MWTLVIVDGRQIVGLCALRERNYVVVERDISVNQIGTALKSSTSVVTIAIPATSKIKIQNTVYQ